MICGYKHLACDATKQKQFVTPACSVITARELYYCQDLQQSKFISIPTQTQFLCFFFLLFSFVSYTVTIPFRSLMKARDSCVSLTRSFIYPHPPLLLNTGIESVSNRPPGDWKQVWKSCLLKCISLLVFPPQVSHLLIVLCIRMSVLLCPHPHFPARNE